MCRKAEESNEFLAAKDAEGKSSAAQEIGKAADAEPRDANGVVCLREGKRGREGRRGQGRGGGEGGEAGGQGTGIGGGGGAGNNRTNLTRG